MPQTVEAVAAGRGEVNELESHQFQAKDGLWYPSYKDMVNANIQYNKDYLGKKGLINAGSKLRKKQKEQEQKIKKNNSTTSSGKKRKNAGGDETLSPVRRSRRTSKKPVEYKPLDDIMELENKRTLKQKTAIKNMGVTKSNRKDSPEQVLKDEDLERISAKIEQMRKDNIANAARLINEDEGDTDSNTTTVGNIKGNNGPEDTNNDHWLDDFQNFLLQVPHGNSHRVVSQQNAKAVLKQVRRMVSGEGITYHHWKNGTYFKKGVKIHLGMNMDVLLEEAVNMENNYGRDLGNGWLMRHPIVKLKCYQLYLVYLMENEEEEKEKGKKQPQEENLPESSGDGTNKDNTSSKGEEDVDESESNVVTP